MSQKSSIKVLASTDTILTYLLNFETYEWREGAQILGLRSTIGTNWVEIRAVISKAIAQLGANISLAPQE